MASLNGFSVKVPECLSETSENYVVMRHGQQYSLKLSNHHKEDGHGKPCDAEVYIDDEFCGSYRIPSGESITLERPEHSNQRFTAYRIGSEEAKIAKIDHNKSMGLIRAVFRPGNKKYVSMIFSKPVIIDEPWPYITKTPQKPWTPPGVYAYAVSDWDTLSTPTFSNNSYSSVPTSNAEFGSDNCSYTASRDLVGGGTGLSGQSNQRFNEVDALDYDKQATSIYLRLAFEDEGKSEDIRPLKKVYSTRVPNPL
jgi:hypothetical protein